MNVSAQIEKGEILGTHTIEFYYGFPITYAIAYSKNQFYIQITGLLRSTGKKIEYTKPLTKEIAIRMLSRINLTKEQEQKIKEIIQEFEEEKLKIQLHDRTNDYLLYNDNKIIEHINNPEAFSFYGEHVVCKRAFPHPPHLVGFYSTIRYGPLDYYCTGKEGEILLKDGRKVKLVISVTQTRESAYGTYMFVPED